MSKIRVATAATDEAATPDKKVMIAVNTPSVSAIGDPTTDSISLQDSAGIKKGKYSKENITNIIKAAKATGVNPHQLLALAWQESNLGGDVKTKLAQEASDVHGRARYGGRARGNIGQIKDFSDAQYKELNDLSTKTGLPSAYLKTAIAFRDKLKYAKQLGFNNEDQQLQAYNGYGKLLPNKDAAGKMIPTRYYGLDVPEGGLDMKQTPLYGRRLMALKSDLMKNKEINDLVNAD